MGARLIAAADSFDAMTTDRPYRGGMNARGRRYAANDDVTRAARAHANAWCFIGLVEIAEGGDPCGLGK